MNQKAIEDYVGIDAVIAKHMMESGTSAANTAMDLLRMQINHAEHCGLALLKAAVQECRAEIITPAEKHHG